MIIRLCGVKEKKKEKPKLLQIPIYKHKLKIYITSSIQFLHVKGHLLLVTIKQTHHVQKYMFEP